MKRIIVIGLMMASMSTFAQKIAASKIPASVMATFNKNYPSIKEVKWEKEKGNYEANYKQNGKNNAVLIDAKGSLLETETAIEISVLPAGVTDYMAKNYKGQKIKEAAKLKMPNGDTNYEAAIKGKDVIFDANGKFIKEVKE